MTPAELSEKLWDNAERVAKFLLPKGHLEGKEWCAGNINGDSGKSLKINIGGKKSWADFASGDSGDLLDLWVLVRNCQLHDAMREAKEFLGLKDDDHHFEAKKKTFSRPTKKGVKSASKCYDYLASRGITRETADRFKVTDAVVWYHEENREVTAVAFPYIRNDELLQVKRIGTERPNGKKLIMAEADCEPCLFGWQALDKNTRLVVLCEGEIDCITDMPDNVMAVWRNIPRELAQRKAERMGYESLDKDEQAAINLPASMIRLLKQREGEGWIGDIGANFDSRSHQFLEGEKKPFNYLVGKPQSELDLEWEASNVTRV